MLFISFRQDWWKKKEAVPKHSHVWFSLAYQWCGTAERSNVLTVYFWVQACKNREYNNQCLAVKPGDVPWLYWPIPSFRPFHVRLGGHSPENMQSPTLETSNQIPDMELIYLVGAFVLKADLEDGVVALTTGWKRNILTVTSLMKTLWIQCNHFKARKAPATVIYYQVRREDTDAHGRL